MDFIIKTICKKDFNRARHFAVSGMHLNWYTSGKLQLYLYSHYFWNLELLKATCAIGAYAGGQLVGVLLVDMCGRPKLFQSLLRRMYVKAFEWFVHKLFSETSGCYDRVNNMMLKKLKENHHPAGEVNFFAVAPETKGQGVGTLLLNELERLEKGKLVYLFTDSGSSFQFYQKRGFEEAERNDIQLKIGKKEVGLTCFLFYKIL
ncbi:GNAT family N-acetyltransferase [Enterobacter sp. DTU_2021_1002640_1_SI_PRY_ASU_LCPMC_013]|uniref:GNAT family N-acetyltransferase n=1 Tax=Enterobacter sp. DTU_2021_1002640_1_SI_PRY_ASU_LCPMC_013 TaxID=3077940 RepID=UPI0028E518C0|nr:GNAT family N-acetyltransferase [Enterobacter sp. DTU_2021_1002640_1_SI_PRY_ASU_LCPMC_013]WNU99161.1 GNAT family N-acetyltransferase [Enterobacter sp. DTU_2021_1002640_1_SI_PRY_ASU_LCPMC_013]